MILLDRIDDRLKSTDFNLTEKTLRGCSTSLPSGIHPSLVSITGGTDDGRNADMEHLRGHDRGPRHRHPTHRRLSGQPASQHRDDAISQEIPYVATSAHR